MRSSPNDAVSIFFAALTLVACGDQPLPTDGVSTSSASGHGAGASGGGTGGGGGVDYGPLAFDFEEIALEGEPMQLTEMKFLPGTTNEFLALNRTGSVRHYRLDGDSASLIDQFDVPGTHADLDCGLLSVTFDPDFETNHFFYVGQCVSMTRSGIFRLTWGSDPAAIEASIAEIIVLGDDRAERPWHNVGSIGFDTEGAMWALFGDKTIKSNGQSTTEALGSLIRISPNREPGGSGYEPVGTNPFAASDTQDRDIYAFGVRSPWKGTLDSHGHYWIGDVGSDFVEEVNLVTAPAQNLGWGTAEGVCKASCDGLRDPLLSWDRSDSNPFVRDDPDAAPVNLRSVWVGPEYRDRGNDRYHGGMTGRVVYGDFCVGFLRVAQTDAQGHLVSDIPVGHLEHASGWDQGPDGYLYATTFGTCGTSAAQIESAAKSRMVRAVRRR